MVKAFSLIELLVVITIIVVLLALLTPALDKAIYQAELTVCAARTRAITTGAQTYAMGYRRHYPFRRAMNEAHRITATSAALVEETSTEPVDDRPVLREAMDIGMLLCPLAQSDVDFEIDRAADSNVYTSYRMYFNFPLRNINGSSQGYMRKIGERWAFDGRRFGIVAADEDAFRGGSPDSRASHPDKDGLMTLIVQQRSGLGAITFTLSEWVYSDIDRGPIDSNYSFTDGSVVLYRDVLWNEANDGERIVRVPHTFGGGSYSPSPDDSADWNNVPVR